MSAFLEGYGVGEARRERRIWKIVIAALILAVLAGIAAYIMRDFREIRQANRFVEHIQQKHFEEAYRLWGCDPAQPCRDYNFQRFLADWQPLDLAKAKTTDKNCSTGVIRTFEFSADNKIYIWIDKGDRKIAYAPFDDSCRQPVIQQSQ